MVSAREMDWKKEKLKAKITQQFFISCRNINLFKFWNLSTYFDI